MSRRSVVCLTECRLVTTVNPAKRLNRSRCHLGWRLACVQGFMYHMGWTTAPPGEYDGMLYAVAAMQAVVPLLQQLFIGVHWCTVMTMAKPSTALVEKNAMFRVSRGLSLVNSWLRLCGSDSPVSDELSTYSNITLRFIIVRIFLP